MKNRIFAGILAAAMAVAMTGCGGSSAPASSEPAPAGSAPAESGASSAAPTDGAPAAPAGDTIKIGGLAPLTGSASQYGIAVANGAKLAVEDINAKGGVLGRSIELIYEDEKADASEAINAYNKLVNQDNVIAIIGDVTSAPSLAVAQRAAQDGIPMMSPSATQYEFTLAGENVFRTCFIDPYQGQLMASYASQKLGAKTAAVIYDNGDSYSTGIADAFVKSAEALGMTITAKEGYQSKTPDFNSQLTKIKEGNPDVIMIPSYYSDVALIAVQAKELGITSTLLGADGWDGVLDQIDKSQLDALSKVYFCSQYSAESTDENLQGFLKKYRETYSTEPNMFAVLSYDATQIVAAAIEKAGSADDAEAIVKALTETNYDGLSGTTTFDENRNPVRSAVILTVADGAYKFVENFEA